jgi:hypothetical protein
LPEVLHWLPRFVVVTREGDTTKVVWLHDLSTECEEEESEPVEEWAGGVAWRDDSATAAPHDSLEDWGFPPLDAYAEEPRSDTFLPDWAGVPQQAYPPPPPPLASPLAGVRGVAEDYAQGGVADSCGFFGDHHTGLPDALYERGGARCLARHTCCAARSLARARRAAARLRAHPAGRDTAQRLSFGASLWRPAAGALS